MCNWSRVSFERIKQFQLTTVKGTCCSFQDFQRQGRDHIRLLAQRFRPLHSQKCEILFEPSASKRFGYKVLSNNLQFTFRAKSSDHLRSVQKSDTLKNKRSRISGLFSVFLSSNYYSNRPMHVHCIMKRRGGRTLVNVTTEGKDGDNGSTTFVNGEEVWSDQDGLPAQETATALHRAKARGTELNCTMNMQT